MDRINTLVSEIKSELSAALKNRIERLKVLEDRLVVAKDLNEKEPSEENKEAFDDLDQNVKDYSEDLETQLMGIIAKEKEAAPAVPAPIIEEKSSNLGWGLLAGAVLAVLTLGAIRMNKK